MMLFCVEIWFCLYAYDTRMVCMFCLKLCFCPYAYDTRMVCVFVKFWPCWYAYGTRMASVTCRFCCFVIFESLTTCDFKLMILYEILLFDLWNDAILYVLNILVK